MEFRHGHPPKALNVPWATQGPRGLIANPDFVTVMKKLFLPSQKLILSCRSGQRSRHAAIEAPRRYSFRSPDSASSR